MKPLFTLLVLMCTLQTIFAQTPEKMSYQAIIRANDNNLVTNSNISLKVIVHQGSPNGVKVFEENHFPKTNSNGLVSLEIGTGSVTVGSFSAIAWQNGPYFVETQVDAYGGSSFNIVGNTQLLSVPYALHAKTAEKLVGSNNSNPYKSSVVTLTSSRSVLNSDVNNIIECTASSTLNLPVGFTAMAIGDTINLEAHNGAILNVQASSGVTLNYSSSGSAIFTSTTGNVRFGLLRKTGVNAYIISGQ